MKRTGQCFKNVPKSWAKEMKKKKKEKKQANKKRHSKKEGCFY